MLLLVASPRRAIPLRVQECFGSGFNFFTHDTSDFDEGVHIMSADVVPQQVSGWSSAWSASEDRASESVSE